MHLSLRPGQESHISLWTRSRHRSESPGGLLLLLGTPRLQHLGYQKPATSYHGRPARCVRSGSDLLRRHTIEIQDCLMRSVYGDLPPSFGSQEARMPL
jgi:hypothetical protein